MLVDSAHVVVWHGNGVRSCLDSAVTALVNTLISRYLSALGKVPFSSLICGQMAASRNVGYDVMERQRGTPKFYSQSAASVAASDIDPLLFLA